MDFFRLSHRLPIARAYYLAPRSLWPMRECRAELSLEDESNQDKSFDSDTFYEDGECESVKKSKN